MSDDREPLTIPPGVRRFELCSLDCITAWDNEAMLEGIHDARLGLPYPGPHRSVSYQFGYDTEAAALGLLPEAEWMSQICLEVLSRMIEGKP